MRARRISKQIDVGGVKVGGDAPVVVQSMTKTDTRDIEATVLQIREMEEAGCEIARCAVPDMDAAVALAEIKRLSNIPIVADIHFHYQLALESLKSGVDCLRLNPGNIRDRGKVETVVREAKARQVPIRIGVNFGSLPPVGAIGVTRGMLRHKDGVNKLPKIGEAELGQYTIVDHMVETGLWEIGILEELDFDLIKISLKAFDVDTTIEAYRRDGEARAVPPPPGHHGGWHGEVGQHQERHRAGRTPVRGHWRHDSRLAQRRAERGGLCRPGDPSSRWTCAKRARSWWRVRAAAAQTWMSESSPTTVDDLLSKVKTPIKVAVMGCEVNGPGEAKDADVGIAAGAGRAIIFRKGQKARIVDEADMLSSLMEEVRSAESEILAPAGG